MGFLLAIPGVRYFMRGVDSSGHVANYVETEQIVFYRNYKSSFVQVRNCVCTLHKMNGEYPFLELNKIFEWLLYKVNNTKR